MMPNLTQYKIKQLQLNVEDMQNDIYKLQEMVDNAKPLLAKQIASSILSKQNLLNDYKAKLAELQAAKEK